MTPKINLSQMQQGIIDAARKATTGTIGKGTAVMDASLLGRDIIASPAGRFIGLALLATAGISLLGGMHGEDQLKNRKRRREALSKHGNTLSSQASLMHEFT